MFPSFIAARKPICAMAVFPVKTTYSHQRYKITAVQMARRKAPSHCHICRSGHQWTSSLLKFHIQSPKDEGAA